jgi:hypothetical protein
MMVPDALENILTRLESQKIVGIENLQVWDWLEAVLRPNLSDPWIEGSRLCT